MVTLLPVVGLQDYRRFFIYLPCLLPRESAVQAGGLSIAIWREEVKVSRVTATGRVVSDPVLRTSVKETPYVAFTLKERIGMDQYARFQYLHVWAWGELAVQLSKAGVKRSSLLRIYGYLELTDCVKSDGVTRDKELRVRLIDWSFLSNDPSTTNPNPKGAVGSIAVINGDRENMPE